MRLLGASDDRLLFLSESGCRSNWLFREQLTTAALPSRRADLVVEIDTVLDAISGEAASLRRRGMLGHSMQLRREMESMMAKRRACLAPHTKASPRQPLSLAANGHTAALTWDASAVAAALHAKHFCVLESFSSSLAPGEMRHLLERMHAAGELKLGEVSAGSYQRSRGDVMQWLGSDACAQPPLSRLLASLDTLIEALCHEPLLAADLGDVLLVRHEIQATCYPGGGARYVKVCAPDGPAGLVVATRVALSAAWWRASCRIGAPSSIPPCLRSTSTTHSCTGGGSSPASSTATPRGPLPTAERCGCTWPVGWWTWSRSTAGCSSSGRTRARLTRCSLPTARAMPYPSGIATPHARLRPVPPRPRPALPGLGVHPLCSGGNRAPI